LKCSLLNPLNILKYDYGHRTEISKIGRGQMPGSGHNEIHYSAKCAIYDYILHTYRDFRPSTKWLDFANDMCSVP